MNLMKIGVIGYGLIGGSMGLALKKYTSHIVYAFEKSQRVRDYVVKNALADEVFSPDSEKIRECDIVFIGLYPKKAIEFINENKDKFKENAIICDLCGVKQYILENIPETLRFIGAHPMAGKEVGGIENADCDLFLNASFLITVNDFTDREALDIIRILAEKVGFSQIVETTPENHDKMITFTSQLPHILSVAYVLQDSFKKCDGFYAGSFKDMSRVAKINPTLWEELFKINKDVLTEQIDEYTKMLNKIKEAVSKEDNELFETLVKSSKLKEWQDENYKN